ncbi:hypothetical protein GCM10011521_16240 [Arenimonas soli]|uniref:Uncharacterized protein n=1 Tax=Arenimonas soli TaxID=2269504 RepID=A0ABQ1HI04_9GAMM|nr:hypothetical protein GCM10011521_16240 [Arenimonas soli]
MPSLVAAAVIFAIVMAIIEIFYSAYSLPLFKEAYPEEFRACGSPSIILIGDGVFFAYLLRNRHKRLANPLIVRMLDRHKWILILCCTSLVALALTLAVRVAA